MKAACRLSAKPAVTSLGVLVLLLAVGCTPSKSAPTPANFTQAINDYYLEHHDCLLSNVRFPFETADKAQTRQMDALVKSLLLAKTEEASIHTSRYTVAPAGVRYAPRFCYGNREVTAIDTAAPLAVVNGFKQTTVTYHYVLKDVPVWARTPEILAAFPAMAQAINGTSTGKITLDQTTASWQVPD